MACFAEFDAAELPLSGYVLGRQMDNPFMAVPRSRCACSGIAASMSNSDSGIVEPADLIGRTAGGPNTSSPLMQKLRSGPPSSTAARSPVGRSAPETLEDFVT
jgi:hypothetical protein